MMNNLIKKKKNSKRIMFAIRLADTEGSLALFMKLKLYPGMAPPEMRN